MNHTRLDLIGKGEFAEVFTSYNDSRDILSAKVFYKGLDQFSSEFIDKLSEDMDKFVEIDYPTILPTFGYCLTDFYCEPHLVVFSEYLSNGSIENFLHNDSKSLTATEKLINVFGIAAGMQHLHSLNILHKNLKPSNIQITKKNWPKVSDIENVFTSQIKTEKAQNPIYTAPEIWRKEEHTKFSDVYSFAMIAYEIMTNKKPFENMSLFDILTGTIQGNRPQFPSNFPPSYRKLIEQCWSQNPNDRPSFDQIVDMIKNDESFIIEIKAKKRKLQNFIYFIDNFSQVPKNVYISLEKYHKQQSPTILERDVLFRGAMVDGQRLKIDKKREKIDQKRQKIKNERELIDKERSILEKEIESNFNKFSSQDLILIQKQRKKVEKQIEFINNEKSSIKLFFCEVNIFVIGMGFGRTGHDRSMSLFSPHRANNGR